MEQICQLDIFLEEKITRMLVFEKSQTEISKTMNVPQCVISRLLQKFQNIGDINRRPVASSPRFTTSYQDQVIALTARRHKCAPELFSAVVKT